jgi:hypothetical protein
MTRRPAIALLALAGLAAAQSGAQTGIGVQAAGRAEADPHRPSCTSASCRMIRSFLKAHYCGESPFGNGPRTTRRWLRRHNCEFGKYVKVIGVEGVDSLNTIGLHGGDNL